MRLTQWAANVVLTVAGSLVGQSANGDNDLEQKIRDFEQEEVAALLRNDLAAMRAHRAEDYTVNNPFNRVVKASEGPINAGALTHSSFVQEIESVQMGKCCLYFKQLADRDKSALETLISGSVAEVRRRYG